MHPTLIADNGGVNRPGFLGGPDLRQIKQDKIDNGEIES
jgi:hypothetical protein